MLKKGKSNYGNNAISAGIKNRRISLSGNLQEQEGVNRDEKYYNYQRKRNDKCI